MIKIIFYLRGAKPIKNIYVRYRPNRYLDISIKTPYSIHSDNWDKENQCYDLKKIIKGAKSIEIKKNNLEIEKFNNSLSRLRIEITEVISENLNLNEEDLKKKLDLFITENYFGYKVEDKQSTRIPERFSDLIDFYIKFRSVRDVTQDKKPLAENTVKKLQTLKNKLENFNKELKISDVNNLFRRDFTAWLDNRDYSEQEQAKNLKDIKTLCLFAETEHVLSPDVKKWKIKASTEIENKAKGLFLSFDQLKTLHQLDLSNNEKLDNTRDWLLISVYTAVRVSELMKMKREDITQDHRERDFIKVIENKNRNKKGGGLKYLPLFDEVKKILNKRHGNFPRMISPQKYNDYIKEVCKEAGFTTPVSSAKIKATDNGNRKVAGVYPFYELVTSHIGRQTFVTLFSDIVGIDVVQMMTNHQSEKMTLHYNKTDYDTKQKRKAEIIADAFNNVEIKSILKIV